MIARIKAFFMESRQEFRHVSWPERNEALRLTGVVIGASVGIALFLGLSDSLFSYLLKTVIFR